MPPKKILFCTDFSENSEPARELAVDYAKSFGAQLIIAHVVDTGAFEAYALAEGDVGFSQIVSSAQEVAGSRLEAMGNECGQLVKDVKTRCKVGLPSKEILALAREELADLIVLGTHGRSSVKELVMGSVARKVLRTAHLPALIVRAP
ncbi:MAG: universal stress protein [Desulfomonilaceae bacterium]